MQSFREKFKIFIKIVAFGIIFVLLFLAVQRALTVDTSHREHSFMTAIYEEEENSLDGIYIGSSNCYTFWNSIAAWEEYGINVLHYGCSRQPLIVAENLIREARKTQPDALYIVNINTLDEFADDIVMHRLLDSMPFSVDKIKLTNYLVKQADLSLKDSLEHYLPIILYHDRWDELGPENFSDMSLGIKNSSKHKAFLQSKTNVTDTWSTTDERESIPEVVEERIVSLLDYCDQEKVNVIFVTIPQAREDVEILRQFNYVNDLITSRGYPILDYMNSVEDTNLNLEIDYYNDTHTNIHGSIKFTYALSEYMIENYGFQDKREDSTYESWNVSMEKYQKAVAPWVLDFEWSSTSRDYTLDVAKGIECVSEDNANILTWKTVEGAEGYVVYRKTGQNGAWKVLAEAEALSYTDVDVKEDKSYTYTVVPFTGHADERLYGNFNYIGVKSDS